MRTPAALARLPEGPDFRRLLRVRVAGQLGDGMFQGALFAAVFFDPTKATSAAQAAAAFTTLLLPYSVVGPFAGVLLDRWPRQRVLREGNLGRAVLAVVFAVVLAATSATSVPVVVLALLVVSVNRFVLSALSAALPHVVEEPRLVTANSASTTLGAGAAATGGGLALALRSVFGSDASGAARTCLVAAAIWVVAATLAQRIPRALLGPDDEPEVARLRDALAVVPRGVMEGARHVRRSRPAARGLAAITSHRFFYGLSTVATLLLYTPRGAIGLGFSGLGQVGTTAVLGGLVAAFVTPRATRRVGLRRWVVLVFAGAAVAQVVFGLPYTHPAFLAAAAILGFAAQASKISVDTLLQETVHDDYRGRVFSFYDTLFNVSFIAAAGVAAVLLPPDGKSYLALGVVAGGYALTALLYGLASAGAADPDLAVPTARP